MAKPDFWSLAISIPENLVEQATALFPEDAVSQSAFKEEGAVAVAGSSQSERTAEQSRQYIWRIECLYISEPDSAAFSLQLAVLSASMGIKAPLIEAKRVVREGWLAANQQSFAPIHCGRIVLHGARDRVATRAPDIGIEMESSAAFGTGEHPTTFGCLTALQKIPKPKRGGIALDLGAGSGVLAMALAKLYKMKSIASDNDAASVDILRHNLRRNGIAGFIQPVQAAGFGHHAIRTRRYNLIVSNIFARPLARLAPAMRRHLLPGGRVVLAGFLARDARMVASAYAGQRIHLEKTFRFGAWTILMLKRR